MAYDNIRIEKGMYRAPGGLTGALEKLDPSDEYKNTELEGLDAYQRQLKRFDISVAGAGSSTVEKFFQTSDSAALFPEYVSRAVRLGMNEGDKLSSIVATTTRIKGMDYRTIKSNADEESLQLKSVAEGAVIPETTIKVSDKLVKLKKRGRMLVASYEALRFQRLDLFTVTLKQIGAHIARQQFADAVSVLTDSASSVTLAAEKNLSYADFISLWNDLYPYELNTMAASPAMISKMLGLTQFQNPNTGINFAGTGKLSTPLGAEVVKSKAVGSDTIIGLDRNYALEMVVAEDVSVDYDRLIYRQLERAAITSIAGFSKIFPEAVKLIKI